MNKALLSAILFIAVAINALGQSASGRYASRLTQDGTVFFFMPEKLSRTENISRFEYDMTCLSWSDSITVNFTFISQSSVPPTDLKITSGKDIYECREFSPLFIDIVKKGFEIRITSKFVVGDIKRIIQCVEPPIFCFKQDEVQVTATYSTKSWRKDRKKITDIFKLINYTTQK